MSENTWVRLVHYNGDPVDLEEIVKGFGFTKYNNNDHICLDLSDQEKVTISIKLKDGKQVTFAVIPEVTNLGSYLGIHSIDIVCANQPKQPWILHGYGYPIYHSAKSPQDNITIGTLLLANEYFQD
jgi:hypothetical protein